MDALPYMLIDDIVSALVVNPKGKKHSSVHDLESSEVQHDLLVCCVHADCSFVQEACQKNLSCAMYKKSMESTRRATKFFI